MRTIHFMSVLAISTVACSGLVGCSSADDTANPEDSGVDQSTQDASVDSGKDAGKDSTVIDAQPDVAKDTGSDVMTDGATDAATDGSSDGGDAGDGGLPPVGSPCNTANEIQQQNCGLCGFQKRACLPADGGLAWSDWGFCQGQVVNGCDPKLSYPDTACGNCGTKKTVCLNNCNFDVTQTCNEPPNACKPQSTEFVLGLSCDAGGRERTCDNQCKFGNFGACQSGPTIPGIIASETVGVTVSSVFTLPASPKLDRPSGVTSFPTCPTTFQATQTSYHYASVKNPGSKTLTVAIYSTLQSGGPTDIIVTLYAGAVPPADNDLTARKSCIVGTTPNDDCSFSVGNPPSCPSSNFFGGHNNITLPPNTTLVVYAAAFSASASGPYQLNVYTSAAN